MDESVHLLQSPMRSPMPSPLRSPLRSPLHRRFQAVSPSQATTKMLFDTPPLRHDHVGASFQRSPTQSQRHSAASLMDFDDVQFVVSLEPPSKENSPFVLGGDRASTDLGSGKFETNALALQWTQPFRSNWRYALHEKAQVLPAIVIAIVLNLMICVPFGLSFFPVEWSEMPVPRALGIQMFLLTTAICQFVFVTKSNFNCSIGMMMVENVPFMHTLSLAILEELGPANPQTLPTILMAYAASTVFVGAMFYLLGVFRLGNIIYMFPKHIIVGAIGGIGAFVLQSGIENATGRAFAWTLDGLWSLFDDKIVWLWTSSALLALCLSLLTRWFTSPLFPPIYFVMIPPAFYLALLVLGIPFETAVAHGWFFDRAPRVEFYLLWEQYDFRLIAWHVLPKQIGTLLGLSLFSLMHVPINIPSLSLTTDTEVDINEELVAHGISNLIGGCAGSVQNYLCYSTSALYYKCGGHGKWSGYLIGCVMVFFLLIGPSVVAYVPRCMAGCLMIHIGIDLLKEALIDTYQELDKFELLTVWVIAMTMTFWGMNQGLAVGSLLACCIFVLQSAGAPTGGPIRGSMSAATMRSNVWRTREQMELLDQESRLIHLVQLKGHIFFGNVNKLTGYIKRLFADQSKSISYLILDFTLVVGMDCSAADRLTKIKHLCDVHACHLVFCAIPSAYQSFSDQLIELFHQEEEEYDEEGLGVPQFCVSEDLNNALKWCENGILRDHRRLETSPEEIKLTDIGKPSQRKPRFKKKTKKSGSRSSPSLLRTNSNMEDDAEANDEYTHLRRLRRLCPEQPLEVIQRLLDHFQLEQAEANQMIWKQGDTPDRVLILLEGQLRAIVEEEAGTTEDICVGAMVGEICFLTQEKRKTSLMATTNCALLVLTRASMEEMIDKDCFLAFVFQQIALKYASNRLQYVGNRIWETKCLPI